MIELLKLFDSLSLFDFDLESFFSVPFSSRELFSDSEKLFDLELENFGEAKIRILGMALYSNSKPALLLVLSFLVLDCDSVLKFPVGKKLSDFDLVKFSVSVFEKL